MLPIDGVLLRSLRCGILLLLLFGLRFPGLFSLLRSLGSSSLLCLLGFLLLSCSLLGSLLHIGQSVVECTAFLDQFQFGKLQLHDLLEDLYGIGILSIGLDGIPHTDILFRIISGIHQNQREGLPHQLDIDVLALQGVIHLLHLVHGGVLAEHHVQCVCVHGEKLNIPRKQVIHCHLLSIGLLISKFLYDLKNLVLHFRLLKPTKPSSIQGMRRQRFQRYEGSAPCSPHRRNPAE